MDGSRLTATRSVLSPAVFAAFAAVLLSFSAFQTARSFQSPALTVDLSEFSWWKKVQFGLDRSEFQASIARPSFEEVKAAVVTPVVLPPAPPVRAKLAMKRALPRLPVAKTVAPKAVPKVVPAPTPVVAAVPVVKDEILISQAMVITVEASEAEKEELRKVYLSLRGRWWAALNTQKAVTTQVAVVEEKPPIDVPWVVRKEAPTQWVSAQKRVAPEKPIPAQKALPQQVIAQKSPAPAIQKSPVSAPAKAVVSATPHRKPDSVVNAVAPPLDYSHATVAMREAQEKAPVIKQPETPEPPKADPPQQTSPPELIASEQSKSTSSVPAATAPTSGLNVDTQTGGYSLALPLIAQNLVTTQSAPQRGTAPASKELAPAPTPKKEEASRDGDSDGSEEKNGSSRNKGHGLLASSVWKLPGCQSENAYEAFGSQCIPGASIQSVTVDIERRGVLRGWKKVSADHHWSTLALQTKGSQALRAPAPLISRNTAALLERIASTQLQADAGIVFGRVPAGWALDFSGRSEAVIYLDSNLQRVGAEDVESIRHFALLNVAPGAHLIYLSRKSDGASVSVAAPVLSSAATYFDFGAPEKRRLNGVVYDARSESGRRLGRVRVRVVGQPYAEVVTNKRGAFALDVWTVSGQPLYVESIGRTGYVHRHRVLPEAMTRVALFRFAESQVRAWVDQLQGGISPESGLLVGAIPSLTAAKPEEPLFPEIKPLLENTTIVPEAYSLSGEDHLMVNAPLDIEKPRFLAVQIPEGASIAALVDRDGKAAWSDLIIASPGVINVVGPEL